MNKREGNNNVTPAPLLVQGPLQRVCARTKVQRPKWALRMHFCIDLYGYIYIVFWIRPLLLKPIFYSSLLEPFFLKKWGYGPWTSV